MQEAREAARVVSIEYLKEAMLGAMVVPEEDKKGGKKKEEQPKPLDSVHAAIANARALPTETQTPATQAWVQRAERFVQEFVA